MFSLFEIPGFEVEYVELTIFPFIKRLQVFRVVFKRLVKLYEKEIIPCSNED